MNWPDFNASFVTYNVSCEQSYLTVISFICKVGIKIGHEIYVKYVKAIILSGTLRMLNCSYHETFNAMET